MICALGTRGVVSDDVLVIFVVVIASFDSLALNMLLKICGTKHGRWIVGCET
jgi:hypothetical protein